ncbi:MAG: smalltalk protein [Prevotella sp.]|nr:smalltalk protein [Prevotella sp.]
MYGKRDLTKFIIQTLLAKLTAIGTTLGVTACMAILWRQGGKKKRNSMKQGYWEAKKRSYLPYGQ